jgi:hypothetical protein
MSLKNLKADAALVVIMLVVIAGGFYMTSKAMNQRSDELAGKLASLEISVKQVCGGESAPAPAPAEAKPADAKPLDGAKPADKTDDKGGGAGPKGDTPPAAP